MEPVRTEDCDTVYKGPTQDIGDLWCHRVRPHLIRTTWEPSEEEYELLRNGGRIQIFVFREPIPPIDINVITRDESEPVGEHGWKIDVEPGDLKKERKENGEDEDESEVIDEVIGTPPETSGEAQSKENGSAATAFPPRTQGDGESTGLSE